MITKVELCNVVCRNFLFDNIEGDGYGWKKSTFLFVLKYLFDKFKEFREEKNIVSRDDDPTSPYSKAMFGNQFAKVFSESSENSRPIIYISAQSKQRQYYLFYVPFELQYKFVKKTEAMINLENKLPDDPRSYPESHLRNGHLDDLYKRYLCGINRTNNFCADPPSFLRCIIFKCLIIAYIDLKKNYPEKFKYTGSTTFSTKRKSDLLSIRNHAFKNVILFENSDGEITLNDLAPKDMLVNNANGVVMRYKLNELEDCLMKSDRNERLSLLSAQSPLAFQYLRQILRNHDSDPFFHHLHRLLRARNDNDNQTLFPEVVTTFLNDYQPLEGFMSRGNEEFCHGYCRPAAQFSFFTGIINLKQINAVHKIRKQFNIFRLQVANAEKQNQLTARPKAALSKFLDSVKCVPFGVTNDYNKMVQKFINENEHLRFAKYKTKDFIS